MDLEENTPFLATPKKPVRKVRYSKSPWLNYLVLLLALVILSLMSIIVIDITGYEIMHLAFKKNQSQEQTVVQQQQQVKVDDQTTDYSNTLDNLVWDEKTNNVQQIEQEDIQNVPEENQNDETPIPEELQFLFEDENQQQFQSATLDIVDDQNTQEAAEQAEILNNDQQLEQYSLIQSGSNIIIPKIDSQIYNYAELPNKMKVLFIQNDSEDAEISLSHFQGYWDTKYFIKCDQCEVNFQEHQTQYLIKTKSDKIVEEINNLGKLIAAEEPKLKQINQQQTQFQYLLSEIANKGHPVSNKQQLTKNYLITPNQLVLIIKGKFQSEVLMDAIVQSDIVLLRVKDVEEKKETKVLDSNSKIIKWNNSKDLNSIKLIYQLENSKELNFIDYFVSTTLQKYIITNKLGLEVKSGVILNEDKQQLYQIQIALPFQDQMDYDQRELAYRLSKIFTNFAHSLENKLLDENNDLSEYCKQMIDQLQIINNLQFDYNVDSKIDYMEIAKNLIQDQVDEALHYKYLVQINPENFKTTLSNLQQSENLLILVSDSQYGYSFMQIPKGSATQDLLFLTQNEIDQHDNGISYSLKELTDQTKQFIERIEDEIKFEFPEINPYVPKNMELVEETEKFNLNDDNVEVQIDVENKIPKINANIIIDSYGHQIYAEYIYERALMSFQDAIDVGYSIDVTQNDKFRIQISGWSDQYSKVFKGFMEVLKEKPNEELKNQLQFKFDMLPEHLKLIQFKVDSILISNYKQPSFGAVGQEYKLKLSGNVNKDEATGLNQVLHKTLSFKAKSKQNTIKLYNLQGKDIIYQIKTQDKWRIVANYYQFIQLNKEEKQQLKIIQDKIKEQSQENRLIFEQKQIGCSLGFFLIQQTSKDLESQQKKINEFVHKSIKELSQDDSKYQALWENKSGLITFFIDDQDRKTNLENLDEIQCN